MTDYELIDKPDTAVPMEQWGKDHWSLLGYLGTRVVEHNVHGSVGELNPQHLRLGEHHRHLASGIRPGPVMDPEHGSRIRLNNEDVKLKNHDDWDVLEDFEEAGIAEIISDVNKRVALTPKGRSLFSEVMRHKSRGGNFAEFSPPDTIEPDEEIELDKLLGELESAGS